MANEQMTEKLRAALSQLDHGNDDHWTADGSPRTSVVQKIAADQTITRTHINEAAPGFARNAKLASATDPVENVGEDNKPSKFTPVITDDEMGQIDTSGKGEGEPLSEAEVEAVLKKRVKAAEDAINAAILKRKDANNEEIAARKAYEKACFDLQHAFPPKTQADNIKDFLADQHRQRQIAAGLVPGRASASQLDLAMTRGNSRGWTRPRDASGTGGRRGIILPDGRQVLGGARRA